VSSNAIRICRRGHIIEDDWKSCPRCPVDSNSISETSPEKATKSIDKISFSQHGSSFSDEAPTKLDSGPVVVKKGPAFVHLNGKFKGQILDLKEGVNVLGRNKDLELNISEQSISRIHLAIIKYDGKYFIADVGSSYGTFVNGIKVQPIQLKNNDIIKIGALTKVKFTD